MTKAATIVLLLFYSPQSEYFVGPVFYAKFYDKGACMLEASVRMGTSLQTTMAWEPEMMGPIPKVVAAVCADGIVADK